MKTSLLSLEGKKIGTVELPAQFNESYHPDLIKRAVLAINRNSRQQYGTFKQAGTRPSISLSRRRHVYKTTYGFGISRAPRKIMSGRGARFNWVGAFAPGTVSGRRAHPPKAEKIWSVKINKKERKKAIRSALSATLMKDLLVHHYNHDTPIVIESKFEEISKTQDVLKVLNHLGLAKELERLTEKKVRAGSGKSRGRKYQVKKGPLIVVSDKCKLEDAAYNIPGIDITQVRTLNAYKLSHGNHPRLTIFTDKAINKMKEGNLFY